MVLKEILLSDIYNMLYEVLKDLSEKYKINFNELHELYLKDIHIKLCEYELDKN